MQILENYSLKDLNTFAIDIKARYFAEINTIEELRTVLLDSRISHLRRFILGGGSNTLFTKDFDGIVIKPHLHGIEKVAETNDTATYAVAANENWHDFVMRTAAENLSGIENLAYIPGEVGAAPVQNIAAYGQTFEDVCNQVTAIDLNSFTSRTFTKSECEFAYRSSIFKTKLNDQFLVTSVQITLSKIPNFDTHYHGRFAYESLATWLAQIKKPPYTPLDVANAIILQRKAKLPEVSEYGTCGSFFVNPFVTIDKFHELEKIIPELQQYPITKMEYNRLNWHDTKEDEIVKIPAGRLLEELGWKGKWIGNVGTFDKHALIIVTNKKATGQEVLAFAHAMQESVSEAYGIKLQSEVKIVD